MARTISVSTVRYVNYPSGEFSARSITADAVVFDVPTAEGDIYRSLRENSHFKPIG